MITYLKGRILQKTTNFLVLETNNIGYKVFVTPEILENKIGSEIAVFTYMKVSDDGQSLFGLPDFETLQFLKC